MINKLIMLLITLFYVSLAFGNSLWVSDISDTLYIGQLINIELDMSDYQPERLFVLRDRSTPEIELFDILTLRDRPWQYLLRIAPFDTGYVRTERIPIYFTAEGRADTLYIEPFSFYVRSSLTIADTLLRDIVPPRSFRWKFMDYFVPILILLVIGAIVYFLMKYFKKKEEEEQEYVDTRPAWMIALELLQEFKQKTYLRDGYYLEYYFELSMILRIFIEKQYRIKAAEMTTYEIKQSLGEIEQKKQIIKILSEMDMVKFAKTIPILKDAEDMLYWIEKYVMSFATSVEANNSENREVVNGTNTNINNNTTEQEV
ncbi:MAG: hypothetical protein FWG98_12465 [Candidatus Cloacimonetes bacterium]|nr:hypothetical protein [Candidatus Cloacimonadota bacterium]